MSIPSTHKVFRRTEGDLPRTVQQTTESLPSAEELGPDDVLIKVHAVSLNFRDVAMLNGRYPVEVEDRGIPCSDCAGEVVAVGTSVQGLCSRRPGLHQSSTPPTLQDWRTNRAVRLAEMWPASYASTQSSRRTFLSGCLTL